MSDSSFERSPPPQYALALAPQPTNILPKPAVPGIKKFGKITGEGELFLSASGCDHHCIAGGVGGTGGKGKIAGGAGGKGGSFILKMFIQTQYEFDDVHGKWRFPLCLIVIHMGLAVGAGGTGGDGVFTGGQAGAGGNVEIIET